MEEKKGAKVYHHKKCFCIGRSQEHSIVSSLASIDETKERLSYCLCQARMTNIAANESFWGKGVCYDWRLRTHAADCFLVVDGASKCPMPVGSTQKAGNSRESEASACDGRDRRGRGKKWLIGNRGQGGACENLVEKGSEGANGWLGEVCMLAFLDYEMRCMTKIYLFLTWATFSLSVK